MYVTLNGTKNKKRLPSSDGFTTSESLSSDFSDRKNLFNYVYLIILHCNVLMFKLYQCLRKGVTS